MPERLGRSLGDNGAHFEIFRGRGFRTVVRLSNLRTRGARPLRVRRLAVSLFSRSLRREIPFSVGGCFLLARYLAHRHALTREQDETLPIDIPLLGAHTPQGTGIFMALM